MGEEKRERQQARTEPELGVSWERKEPPRPKSSAAAAKRSSGGKRKPKKCPGPERAHQLRKCIRSQ